MLSHLDIRNIVLIDHLAMEMSSGFSVLTGETGAGKSILLDALGLLRGDRGEGGLVRKGADQAVVQALFDVPSSHGIWEMLENQGIIIDTKMPVILRRTLTADGKSRAFINDQSVTISFLKTIGCVLMDIHGQFDTSQIFDPLYHRDLVDSFGALNEHVRNVQGAWKKLGSARASYDAAKEEQAHAIRDEEYFRVSLADLEKLGAKVGEEQDLLKYKQIKAARAQMAEGLAHVFDLIEGENGADVHLAHAARIIDRMRDKIPDDKANIWLSRIDSALEAMREVAANIESLAQSDEDKISLSEEQMEDRLYDLRSAARRHGCRPDELPSKMSALRLQIDSLDQSGARLAELARDVIREEDNYMKQATALSQARTRAAKDLCKMVNVELVPLKLDRARFDVFLEHVSPEKYGPSGIDRIRFMGAMNMGADMGPLDKIASGGELSRLVLALKVALFSRAQTAVSLIFDEVDSGLGGAVAAAVAERLARLSRSAQVLAVTHAPQVAAQADHHLIVSKEIKGKETFTRVFQLPDTKSRCEEIARMLSGAHITDEARAAAGKLLEQKAA